MKHGGKESNGGGVSPAPRRRGGGGGGACEHWVGEAGKEEFFPPTKFQLNITFNTMQAMMLLKELCRKFRTIYGG